MWRRSATAPAFSKANWVSASQLVPGARRIRTRGLAMFGEVRLCLTRRKRCRIIELYQRNVPNASVAARSGPEAASLEARPVGAAGVFSPNFSHQPLDNFLNRSILHTVLLRTT